MKGAFRIGSRHGVPIFVHWTAPIGFFVFFGFSVRPVGWLVLAALILMHEWGHAALVRRSGFYVQSIVLTGTGGECAWAGNATPTQRAIIAWGGVLGQVPGLLVGLALGAILPVRAPALVIEATTTLVSINLLLMAVNLLPIPGLDGWKAWRLFAPANVTSAWRSLRRRGLKSRAAALQRELDRIRKQKKR